MIGSLGWQELLIILVILALIFGASRVADLGGALGRGIREFRSEAANPSSEDDEKEPVASTKESSSDSEESSSSG